MADVFLSWFAPDKEVVRRLQDRLTLLASETVCPSIWEYKVGMNSGDQITKQVQKEILSIGLSFWIEF